MISLIVRLKIITSDIYCDGIFGVRIDWIKPFSFLLDPKVMAQVNHLPEKCKSRSAGNQGRFSNPVIDEIILDFMIWEVEKGRNN